MTPTNRHGNGNPTASAVDKLPKEVLAMLKRRGDEERARALRNCRGTHPKK
jgi:hypothetical protein